MRRGPRTHGQQDAAAGAEECQDVIVSERADQIVPPSPAEKKGGGETVRSRRFLVGPGGAKTPTAGRDRRIGPGSAPRRGRSNITPRAAGSAAHDTLEERRIEPHRHQRAEPRAEEPQGDHSGQEPPIHLATGGIVPRTEEGPQCPGEFIGGHGSGSGTPMASHAGVVSAEALPPLMPPSSAATNAMQRTRTALNAVPVHCSPFTVHRSPAAPRSPGKMLPVPLGAMLVPQTMRPTRFPASLSRRGPSSAAVAAAPAGSTASLAP